MAMIKNIALHLASTVSALWVILNFTFWMIPLMFFGFVKTLVPIKFIRHLSHVAMEHCYRATAWLNSIWMLKAIPRLWILCLALSAFVGASAEAAVVVEQVLPGGATYV